MTFNLDDLRTQSPIRPGLSLRWQAAVAIVAVIVLAGIVTVSGNAVWKWVQDPFNNRGQMLDSVLAMRGIDEYRDRSENDSPPWIIDIRLSTDVTYEDRRYNLDQPVPVQGIVPNTRTALCVYWNDGHLLAERGGYGYCPEIAVSDHPWLTKDEFAESVGR